MSPAQPNIVLVVLDTGRGDIVDNVTLAGAGLASLGQLRETSLVFPRAYSPSTWTYPSHASILTGLYPWENSSLSTEFAPLRGEFPHLAQILGERGYRTLALSANPLVSPGTGLAAPFQESWWSQWWHLFLRVPALTNPLGREKGAIAPTGPDRALPSNLFTLAKRVLLRKPGIAAASSRVAAKFLESDPDLGGEVDPWIEGEFERWLSSQPAEVPVFALINLMEAHEPYLPAPREDASGVPRMVRQDREEFLAESWLPSQEQLESLRTLYRDGVRTALKRVSSILTLLASTGRLDNTVFVLTGDHGQEFGELDGLFHGTYPGDPQVRVPMWLRVPGQDFDGRPARGISSLVDLFPTILRLAGVRDLPRNSGEDLVGLADRERQGPVYSFSEQLPDGDGFRMRRGSQWIGLNRFWVAARHGSASLVVDTHRNRAYRGSHEPGSPPGRPRPLDPAQEGFLHAEIGTIDTAIRRVLDEQRLSGTDRRLRSWGYF